MPRQQSVHPGPIVLDFEDHYLRGKPEVARHNYEVLKTLIQWRARQPRVVSSASTA
ncbi:hypothetical protein [Actinomadura rudentiformis]|uniref:hypothetical protein n=1 Tax=Actinomadura rudentiformis TaxID=359158 RepID=UPI00178C42C3|nr:hypothetical protein [Actinomadura rudentiformis]